MIQVQIPSIGEIIRPQHIFWHDGVLYVILSVVIQGCSPMGPGLIKTHKLPYKAENPETQLDWKAVAPLVN